jgi:hypothetical protein
MPGLAQIKRGHFVAYHWNINRLVRASEWPVVIKEGYGIRIAFVMGTWLPKKRDNCIRCLKPMRASPGIKKGELRSWYVFSFAQICGIILTNFTLQQQVL